MSTSGDRQRPVGRNPFVFIVGCARSGTTLLRRMVDAHPEIAIVPELDRLSGRYASREGLTPDGLVTPAFLRRLLESGFPGRFERLSLSRQAFEEMLGRDDKISYADLVTRLVDRYGEARGKTLVGNKSVDEVLHMPTLHELWPQAKFVHLIRDGHDVCLSVLSWRGAEKLALRFPSWREDPVSTAAAWWEWRVRAGRDAGRALGAELYYELRYEALVARPAEEIGALCSFLGIPYDEAMVRFHEGRQQSGMGFDAKHAWLPPTPGLRDWRSQMPREELARFETMAGALLEELGYQRGALRPSEERLAQAARVRHAFKDVVVRANRLEEVEGAGTSPQGEEERSPEQLATFDDLNVGTWVEVRGSRENRRFVALRVNIRAPRDTATMQGRIEGLNAGRKAIRLLDRDVALPDSCDIVNLMGRTISFRDLAVGTRIKLAGTYAESTGFVPSSVKFLADIDVEELRGYVDGIDADGKTFDVLGFRVAVTELTEVKDKGERWRARDAREGGARAVDCCGWSCGRKAR
jgi:Sulfotransferase family/Domain of unknown function (DUF5666)